MIGRAKKDPDAILPYTVDWTKWLSSDTIATSTFTADTGITIGNGSNGADAPTKSTVAATVWLIGGTVGETYEITNQITTAAAKTEDRTFKILCEER